MGQRIKKLKKIRLHREVEHDFEFEIVSDAPVAPAAPKAKEEVTVETEEN